jgi:hypothetical protein
VLSLPLLLVACDGETCAGACAQYYGSGEGQCNQQSTNQPTGTTQVEAESDCVKACQAALYTTSSADESGSIGGVTLMSNETDALDFIHCVVDKDFTGAPTQNPGADTCEQLSFDCERLRLW